MKINNTSPNRKAQCLTSQESILDHINIFCITSMLEMSQWALRKLLKFCSKTVLEISVILVSVNRWSS